MQKNWPCVASSLCRGVDKCIHIWKKVCIYWNPPLWAGWCNTRSIFKWSKASLNSVFFFSPRLTKAKEPTLPNNLPIAVGRTVRFMPFSRVLAQIKIQQPCLGFELWLLITFLTMITIKLSSPPKKKKSK